VLAIWTLYGLPMRAVRVPGQNAALSKQEAAAYSAVVDYLAGPTELAATIAVTRTITPTFTLVDTAMGRYYTIGGQIHALAGRPVQPRLSLDLAGTAGIAHGTLLVGGRTRDMVANPLVSRIITDSTNPAVEPIFDSTTFYPDHIAAVNRLLRVEGDVLQRLVLVPGQFRATSSVTQTVGIQRLWEQLRVVTYHAPFSDTDFIAPNLWRATASGVGDAVRFTIEATDAGGVSRTVILYRLASSAEWRSLDLTPANLAAGVWTGLLPGMGKNAVEFIAQAVDRAGNVAWRDSYGNPFVVYGLHTYLPLLMR
jgi:hypothetical protein